MDFQPTAEQQAALDLFAGGGHLALQAGAGTGKSATLRALALEHRTRRVQYSAFNKAVVADQHGRMGRNVRVGTMHKLAFMAVGHRFEGRRPQRRASTVNAADLKITEPVRVPLAGGGHRRLTPGYLASYVLRALSQFCQSDDPEPTTRHFPHINGLDAPDPLTGRRIGATNTAVRQAMLPALRRAWADAQDPDGVLPFYPDRFLKVWGEGLHPDRPGQVRPPLIGAEILMIDEAQDMSPIMLKVIRAQMAYGTQTILVGDSCQAINSFTGAVDAFRRIDLDHTAYLTRSFRFGDEIAEFANRILARLDTPLRLTGRPGAAGRIGRAEHPDVILCRTNALAVAETLRALRAGRRAHLVGHTARNVVSFAAAAIELRERGFTPHHELSCFASWGQVRDYVENDELGGDLALMVKLVDEFGPEPVIAGLRRVATAVDADLTVATTHQSKGLEWDTVRLAADFPGPERLTARSTGAADEQRLLYVAVTRARGVLDPTHCPSFDPPPDAGPGPPRPPGRDHPASAVSSG